MHRKKIHGVFHIPHLLGSIAVVPVFWCASQGYHFLADKGGDALILGVPASCIDIVFLEQ